MADLLALAPGAGALLTGGASAGWSPEEVRPWFRGLLLKPFTADQLLRAVAAALRRGA